MTNLIGPLLTVLSLISTTAWADKPIPLSVSNPKMAVSGEDHACVLDDNGVACWGKNYAGQIDVPTLIQPTAIAAGEYHTCAVDQGAVKCWGSNSLGQIDVPPMTGATTVVAGKAFTCALDSGEVKCWGYDFNFPKGLKADQIIARNGTLCAITNQQLICYGFNSSGQANPPPMRNSRSVVLGTEHGCAITDDGVQCWGYKRAAFVPSLLKNPRMIAAYGYFTCALDDDGGACWGDLSKSPHTVPFLKDAKGVFTGTDTACVYSATQVVCGGNKLGTANFNSGFIAPTSLALGLNFGCVIDDGKVKCFDANTPSGMDIPQAPALVNPTKVAVGDAYACATDANGVTCFGKWTPVAPKISDSVQVLTAGDRHACALHGGQVSCWGSNNQGEATVPSLNRPTALSAGSARTCVIDSGEIKCWGINRDIPSEVSRLNDFYLVSTYNRWSCGASKSQGIICWTTYNNNTFGIMKPQGVQNPTQLNVSFGGGGGGQRACALESGLLKCWNVDYANLTIDTYITKPALELGIGGNPGPGVLDADGVKRFWESQDTATFRRMK